MDEEEYLVCEECDNEFKVIQPEGCESDILFCPFCGEDYFED